MRRTARGLVAAAMAATALVAPSMVAGAGTSSTPYTCNQTNGDTVPAFNAELFISEASAPISAKVYQPLTWRFDIEEPELAPPLAVNLNYLRIRLPIPDNLANVTARAVAAPGETPNPSLDKISVTVDDDEIVVQLPNPAATSTGWIRADTEGKLTYPSTYLGYGNPVLLPQLEVSAVPTPDAGGTPVAWVAPSVEAATTIATESVEVTCTPDGATPPILTTVAVSTQRQLCDGKPVTVQVDYNLPTGGADVIQGTAVNDFTNGLGGNDRYCGLGGVDTWHGGPGNDRAVGGAGNDKLFGDAGDDRLQGDAGADTLNGGAGRDALIGGAQRDTCIGGPQTDTQQTCEVRQQIP